MRWQPRRGSRRRAHGRGARLLRGTGPQRPSRRSGRSVDLGETVQACWNPLIRTLTSLPQPVIARVNGVAAGAGANIALACDIVIAAKSAKFIQSFSAIGLIPDSGGTWSCHGSSARRARSASRSAGIRCRRNRPPNGA